MKKAGEKTTKLPIIVWIGIGIIGLTAIGGSAYNLVKPQTLGEGVNTINVLPEWKSILEGKAMNQRTVTDVVLIGKTATASSTTILEVSGNSYFDGTASISGAINLGNLKSCDTIDSDANGLLSCGSDASGAGAVVSHGLLDSESHTDVLTASVSQGSLIIGNATPKWSELTIGASQSFFMSNGTTAGWYDYVDQNTTYTATDPLWITGTTIDIDIASAGGSGYLNVTDWQNWTDHVASTNAHLDWTVDQGATNINAGNYTDTNTTYTATEPLSLVGTAFDIDYASGTSDGYLLGRDYETLWGHQASVNAHVDWSGAGAGTIHTDNYIEGITYTAGDNLTLTVADFDLDPIISITGASISADLDVVDVNITSLSATTLNFPNDSIQEADIDMDTVCGAGSFLYVSGNDFACAADDDVPEVGDFDNFSGGTNLTYDTSGNTLNVDDPFVVANASASSEFSTPSGQITSLSVSTIFGGGLADCDNATTSKLLWSDTGVFSCGTDQSSVGGLTAHGLLADSGHNDVSNASASAGALIYGSGTTWTPLAVGASNSFLISDGTNPIYKLDPDIASMSITNLVTSTLTGTLTGDLTCTDCLNATEIEDIYFLNTGDTAVRASISDSLTVDDILRGATITDGTATLTGGNWTGIGSLTATTGLFTHASVSNDFETSSAQITSASIGTLVATTLTFPADSITEANINFSTACAAGNHFYLSGTNLACEADANTTYTATDPLFLTGTAFDIDYASAGGGGYILGTTWEDFNGKLSSLSIDTSAELITIIGDETGSGHLVFDTSPELTTSFTTTGVFAINPGGALTIGDGGDTLYINSSDWDISTTGDLTNIGAITMDGILTVASSTVGFGGNVDFYSTASTSSNFDFNSAGLLINIGNAGTDFTTGGGLNIAGVFALATDQLWTSVNTGNLMSSHSWQFTTGTVEFDGVVSTSGNWTGYAGAWDLGALGSFELPNSTTLTLDANGEAYIDTTAGQLQYYSNEVNVLMSSQSFSFTISSPSFDLTLPAMKQFLEPATILGYTCGVTAGTSKEVEILICSAMTCGNGGSVDGIVTATTAGVADDGTLASASVLAGDWVTASVSQGDVSGTPNWLSCTIFYKWTAQ